MTRPHAEIWDHFFHTIEPALKQLKTTTDYHTQEIADVEHRLASHDTDLAALHTDLTIVDKRTQRLDDQIGDLLDRIDTTPEGLTDRLDNQARLIASNAASINRMIGHIAEHDASISAIYKTFNEYNLALVALRQDLTDRILRLENDRTLTKARTDGLERSLEDVESGIYDNVRLAHLNDRITTVADAIGRLEDRFRATNDKAGEWLAQHDADLAALDERLRNRESRAVQQKGA